MVSYDDIVPAILRMMNSQNARDVEVLKENDFLGYELNKFRKMFEDREGSLVSGLIQKF